MQKQRHSIVADNVVFLGGPRAEAWSMMMVFHSDLEEPCRQRKHDDAVTDALFKDEAPFTDDLPF